MTLELTLDLDWASRWRGVISVTLERQIKGSDFGGDILRLWEPGVEGAATMRWSPPGQGLEGNLEDLEYRSEWNDPRFWTAGDGGSRFLNCPSSQNRAGR